MRVQVLSASRSQLACHIPHVRTVHAPRLDRGALSTAMLVSSVGQYCEIKTPCQKHGDVTIGAGRAGGYRRVAGTLARLSKAGCDPRAARPPS